MGEQRARLRCAARTPRAEYRDNHLDIGGNNRSTLPDNPDFEPAVIAIGEQRQVEVVDSFKRRMGRVALVRFCPGLLPRIDEIDVRLEFRQTRP